MVEGLFAGYKQHTDGTYDRTSYENWKGLIELPIRTTKEFYVPGEAANSRDSDEFQFLVKDGEWISKAPELNRYRKSRYNKKDAKDSREGSGAAPTRSPALQPDEAKDEKNEAESDLFEIAFQKVANKPKAMNEGNVDSYDSTDSPEDDAEKAPPDVWVRRGEYVVRKHLKTT